MRDMALIGWWPLDGNTEDYTVNQNHGTPTNVTYVNGKIGQAGSFNGTSSQIVSAQNLGLSGNPEFSIAYWTYYNGTSWTSDYPSIFGNNTTFIGNSGLSTTWRDGRPALDFWNLRYRVNTPLLVQKWYHVTFTKKSGILNGNTKIYIDGVLVAGAVEGTDAIPSIIDSVAVIGRLNANTGRYWNGLVNDVRIYDHVLSQKEINDLSKAKVLHYTFNKDESIIYDGSGYKRNGTKGNNPVWTSGKLGSGAYDFNASNVTTNLNVPIKEFTISFFAKFNTYEYMQILTPNGTSFSFKWRIASQTPYWNSYWSGGQTLGMNYGFKPPLDEWHMYTLSHNGVTFRWYYDGVLISSRTASSGVFNNITQIKTSENAGEFMRGSLDDIRIYTTALSDADILDLYKTRIKLDNQGNLYTNEIIEDYEVKSGLTLRQLFEEKSIFDGTFNQNELLDSYSKNENTHTGIRNHTAYVMFGDPIKAEQIVEPGDKIYARFDYFSSSISTDYFRVWIRKTSDNLDSLSLYFINGVFSNPLENYSAYSTYNGSSTLSRFHYLTGTGTVGALLTLRNPFIFNVTKVFGSGNEPTQEQINTWYKDYSLSRPKSSGIFKSREFIEDNAEFIFKDRQLLTNPNFDNGTAGWVFNANTSVVDGRARFLSSAGVDSYILQNVPSITVGDVMYVRFDLEVISGVLWVNNNGSLNFNTTGTHSLIFTATDPRLLLDDQSNQTTEFYIDNVKFYNLTKLNLLNYSKTDLDQMFNTYEQGLPMKIFDDKVIIRSSIKEV